MNPKDYLGYENDRNKKHGQLFVDIVKRAFGDHYDVLIGHHITFEACGDLQTENEIPSADTLIFDHQIMGRVFGGRALEIMRDLATIPPDRRDEVLAAYFAGVS